MTSSDIQKGQTKVQRLSELKRPIEQGKFLFDQVSSSGVANEFPKMSKELISGLEETDLGHESRYSTTLGVFVPNL